MGQVLSYIWRCLRPRPRGDHETRTTATTTIQQQQQQSHHYITIPHSETQHIVSGSNPDDDLSPQVPCLVVDLNNVEQTVANKEEELVLLKKEISNDNKVSCETKETPIKKIGQYDSKQKILLIGEGDFSFSACLAVGFGSASNIIATSLNSQEFLIENYGKFLSNKMDLESRGSTVIHGIDARTMAKHPLLGTLKFDRIIFNFPHAGNFGQTDSDLGKHKELVRGFLRNAKKMINENGEIHITHKSNGLYLEWNIQKIGSDQGLRLIQEMKFRQRKYPGYHTKYGFGGDKDFECNPCKTYKFGLNLPK